MYTSCETSPYHLYVGNVNYVDTAEQCEVFKTNAGINAGPLTGADISGNISSYIGTPDPNTAGMYYMDMGSCAVGDLFFFNGSGWTKCTKDVNDHISH